MQENNTSTQKKENTWLNLGFNIIAPTLILIKGAKIAQWIGLDASGEKGNLTVFAIALLFPLVYGVYDFATRRKWNIFSIVGFASVILTGGIGLLKLSREWMIVKEGSVPLILGVAVLATAFSKKPLAKLLLMNDSVVNTKKINFLLDENNAQAKFQNELKVATYFVAASFLLSSVLNFALASCIFKSEAGTEAFNAEVGQMTALSFPVIVLPTMVILIFAIFKLFASISKLTGAKMEDLMLADKDK